MKIHLKSDQGIKNNTAAGATKLSGEQPNHHLQDLFEAIEKHEYPSWTVYAQVMEPKDAETYRFNVFDMTKVWPHEDYPLRPFGKVTLDKNVSCYQHQPQLSRNYTDMKSSLKTTLQKSNKLPSHPQPWFQELGLPVTQVRFFPLPPFRASSH